MATIPYDIAAKITLINLVSPVIGRLVTEISGLENKIGGLTKAFEKMSLAGKLAFGGAVGIGVGAGIFEGLKYAVDKAKELNHELVQLDKLGLNPTQKSQAQAAAFALHAQVPGITSAEASKLYGASYSQLGHENAIKMLKAEAEFVQVLGSQTGDYKGAVDKIYNMVKAGDLMGKFMDKATHQVDVGKLQQFFDLGARVITATHNRVNANTWLALAQQGGPAMSGMSDEGLLSMAMVAQAMGGHRAGTALSSIFQQMRGGTMTQYRAEQFHKWGFVGDYHVGPGGHINWEKGALDPETHPAIAALQNDPLKFAKMLLEKLIEEKGKDTDKQIPMLYQLFQRQTSIREMHDMIRNMAQMEQERPRIAAGLGISAASGLQNSKDYIQVMHNFRAAWDELMAHLGMPLAEGAIPVLKAMTKALDGFTEWGKTHQEQIGNIGKGLAILATGLTALGVASVIAALTIFVPGGVGILGLIGLASGLAALGALKDWNFIKEIDKLGDKIKDAFQAMFDKIGEWLKSWLPEWAIKHANFSGGGFGGGLINASYGGGSGASIGGSPHGSYLQYANMIQQYGGSEASNLMKIYRTEGPQGYAVGDHGTSFGPFQAHLGGPGSIGTEMMRSGINIRDPGSVRAQIEWMKRYGQRTGGYSSQVWHGLRDKGVGSLRSGSRVVPYSGSKGQQEVHVHSPVYLDGRMIASNTVTHILKSSEHSRGAAYFDAYHSYAGPDRQTATA